ncbi:MAG TPA: TonB family protein [Deltaproteobacteria bacterium]|nr:TonB family protein [Deltaproteobacteria bacterium]
MGSKKAILLPVVVSFVIHISLITVTGVVDLRQSVRDVEILSVSIEEIYPEATLDEAEEEFEEKSSYSDEEDKEKVAIDDGWREDTVELGSLDVKYAEYLKSVKRKILIIWQYPPKAYERNEEGNVTVRLSVDADGTLARTILLSSSGSLVLDSSTLNVVKAAAPYDPLPGYYNLSRLHIIASFRYRIRS